MALFTSSLTVQTPPGSPATGSRFRARRDLHAAFRDALIFSSGNNPLCRAIINYVDERAAADARPILAPDVFRALAGEVRLQCDPATLTVAELAHMVAFLRTVALDAQLPADTISDTAAEASELAKEVLTVLQALAKDSALTLAQMSVKYVAETRATAEAQLRASQAADLQVKAKEVDTQQQQSKTQRLSTLEVECSQALIVGQSFEAYPILTPAHEQPTGRLLEMFQVALPTAQFQLPAWPTHAQLSTHKAEDRLTKGQIENVSTINKSVWHAMMNALLLRNCGPMPDGMIESPAVAEGMYGKVVRFVVNPGNGAEEAEHDERAAILALPIVSAVSQAVDNWLDGESLNHRMAGYPIIWESLKGFLLAYGTTYNLTSSMVSWLNICFAANKVSLMSQVRAPRATASPVTPAAGGGCGSVPKPPSRSRQATPPPSPREGDFPHGQCLAHCRDAEGCPKFEGREPGSCPYGHTPQHKGKYPRAVVPSAKRAKLSVSTG